jgi:hypothetical protein
MSTCIVHVEPDAFVPNVATLRLSALTVDEIGRAPFVTMTSFHAKFAAPVPKVDLKVIVCAAIVGNVASIAASAMFDDACTSVCDAAAAVAESPTTIFAFALLHGGYVPAAPPARMFKRKLMPLLSRILSSASKTSVGFVSSVMSSGARPSYLQSR